MDVQGRGGSAVALSVSAAMVARYVALRYPAVSRLAVVQGVSAGSAAAVLAANRRLLAGCGAQGQTPAAARCPLMVSVLLEGAAGSDASVLAAEAEQCSREGGWEYKVVDGRRLRARADVASIGAHSSNLTVYCSHSFSHSNNVPYVWTWLR